MIVQLGRIMLNRIDKNLQKITIPKTNNITVTTDINSVDNITLNLESWIEHMDHQFILDIIPIFVDTKLAF